MRLTRMRAGHDRRAFPLALIAVAAVAATAACGSTAGKPAAEEVVPPHPTVAQTVTSTPPAAPLQEFVSQRYRFRVTLGKDWSEADARVAWNGKKLQGLDSAAFANFTDRATDRTLVAGAARVAKGTRLAQWRAAMVRAAPLFCTDSPSVRHTTFGGEPAVVWTAACSDGYRVTKLAALHATRGYIILLASPTANDMAKNRRTFESIRQSFRFTGQ
jgi:hypothetical protein